MSIHASTVRAMSQAERISFVEGLSPDEASLFLYTWEYWAREDQLLPAGDWTTWLTLAGRGWGKTRVGAETVIDWVQNHKYKRIALVAETAADARDVMVEGDSGIIACSPPWFKPLYEPSKRRITWPNGAIATCYNAVEPDQLRGPQFDAGWCLVRETTVLLSSGQSVPIADIRSGDLVQTRGGPRRVLWSGVTGRQKPIFRLTTSDGRTILGTPNHPVWVDGRGFVPMGDLVPGDVLCVTDALSGTGRTGMSTRAPDTMSVAGMALANSCTRRLLGCILAPGQLATMFTTLTGTISTTIRRIWSILQSLSTEGTMQLAGQGPMSSVQLPGRRLRPFVQDDQYRRSSVHGAIPSLSPMHTDLVASALHSAENAGETVQVVVASVEPTQTFRDVYDLLVEDAHEFYAEGILVHNCDELAKWRYAQDTWDNLQFGLRLGARPRQVVTTTPRAIKLIRMMLNDPTVHVTRGRTLDNKDNLASSFIRTIVQKYEGTRLGRQELNAEVLDDVPGALWTMENLDRNRAAERLLPGLRRVVVAIDPAVTSGEDADETGIVVAALGMDGHYYILEDVSGNYTPTEWGQKAVQMYRKWSADRIVAETNNGGDMVELTIRVVDKTVAFRAVHASRGKVVRAEPVSALYERNLVHHVGVLSRMEDQMVAFTTDFDRRAAGYSPDRVDALVWAMTELMVSGDGSVDIGLPRQV